MFIVLITKYLLQFQKKPGQVQNPEIILSQNTGKMECL